MQGSGPLAVPSDPPPFRSAAVRRSGARATAGPKGHTCPSAGGRPVLPTQRGARALPTTRFCHLQQWMRYRIQIARRGYVGCMREGSGDRDGSALQDDRKLRPAKLAAGIVSVVVLVGLFVTSLFRAPEPAWTVVLVVTACALATAVGL